MDDNGAEENPPQEARYEITEIHYWDYDEPVGKDIDIWYPQISGLQNKQQEQHINDVLVETAFDILQQFTSLDEMEIEVQYFVTLASETILSVYFEISSFHIAQPYPRRTSSSVTFTLETGERIGFSDIVEINQDFRTSFYDNFHIIWNDDNLEGKQIVEEDVMNTFGIDKLHLIDKYDGACSYLTEDSLVVSIAVRKSAGSIALFEAKLSEIESFLRLPM